MRCKKPLLGNVLVVSKHFRLEAEKNYKLILWYISEVFRPLQEQYLYSCLSTVGNLFSNIWESGLTRNKKREREREAMCSSLSHGFCNYQSERPTILWQKAQGCITSTNYSACSPFSGNLPFLDVVYKGIREIWHLAFFWFHILHFQAQ